MENRWLRLASIVLLLLVAGCGGRDPNLPEMMPVSGAVTLNKKPISDAVVWFIPAGSTRGPAAGGRTDQDGNYELFSARGETGTAVGEYRVTIQVVAGIDMMPGGDGGDETELLSIPPARPVASPLPRKYSIRAKTPLTATVSEGGSVIDFAL